MIIFNEQFVFIHLPKTGGTFVHHILNELVSKLNFTAPGRMPLYKINNTQSIPYLDNQIHGRHGGVEFIPEQFRHLPIVTIIRNPYDRYVSIYKFEYWKRYPIAPLEQIEKQFPNFLELSFAEFMLYTNNFLLPKYIGGLTAEFGYYSWQFIKFFCHNPYSVVKLPQLSIAALRKKIQTDLANITFLRMDRLHQDLYDFLQCLGYAATDIEFILSVPKVLPPNSLRTETAA